MHPPTVKYEAKPNIKTDIKPSVKEESQENETRTISIPQTQTRKTRSSVATASPPQQLTARNRRKLKIQAKQEHPEVTIKQESAHVRRPLDAEDRLLVKSES